jgi:uncharacterized protein YndB with AHSA1/START domain
MYHMVHNVHIHVSGTSTASPQQLWPYLADAEHWKDWAPFKGSELVEPGRPEPDGVGALRRFSTGRTESIERVVTFEPNRRLAYTLVSGLPLRDYRAEVTLTPNAAGGTTITWESRFHPKVRGTGWLYGAALRTFIRRLVKALAAAPLRAASSTAA